MFYGASAFDQTLCWDIPETATTTDMFTGSSGSISAESAYAMADSAALQTAVGAWCNDSTSAASTYGHIKCWDTSAVTDMSLLFSRYDADWNDVGGLYCSSYDTFDDDISAWQTSSVTNMYAMFHSAASFNGDVSNFDTSSVTNMYQIFYYATSFNQDTSSWISKYF